MRRAYLGLVSVPTPLDERWVERTGRRRALRVAEVVTGSPAAASGIQPGDLIIAIDGTPLADAQSLQRLMFEDAIGRRTEITVLRNGAMVDVVTEPRSSSTDHRGRRGAGRVRRESALDVGELLADLAVAQPQDVNAADMTGEPSSLAHENRQRRTPRSPATNSSSSVKLASLVAKTSSHT